MDTDSKTCVFNQSSCNNGFTVNKDHTNSVCDESECSLRGALAIASTCNVPTTVNFYTDTDPTKNLSTITISQPVKITAVNPITIDGGANRVIVKNTGSLATAFEIVQGTVTLKNLSFDSFVTPGPLVQIDSGATNSDVRNLSSTVAGVALLQSQAADSSDSNVPVMVAKSGTANQYVLYAILPLDTVVDMTNLRFCRTTSTTSNDCLDFEKTLTAGAYTTVTTYRLVDPSGNSTSDTKTLVEIAFDASVIDVNQNYMVMVKNPNKSVAIANLKAGLSPIFGAASDTDGDSLRDIDETTYFGTDPSKSDTDGDGISDFYNMIGVPGQTTVQNTGASVYPSANPDGFLPGNYTLASTAAAQTPAPTSSSSGCSMVVVGGDLSETSSSFVMFLGCFGMLPLILKRRAVSKK
jgi:hypothetical protein